MRYLILALVMILSNQVQNDIQTRHSRYMERAEVKHSAGSVAVTANDSRPLAQAATALSEEFAWIIDFEDPPFYSAHDLMDDTDARWRSAHPAASGVTVIAGDTFHTEFPENSDSSPATEEHVLEGVVSDYNASTNPGRFTVRNEGDGRFAIVGTHVKDDNGRDEVVTPLLDTPISIPAQARDANTTLDLILNALAVQRKVKVVPFIVPQGALSQFQVTVGGDNVPARVLLSQVLSAAKLKMYWRLYYDHDVKLYGFSLMPLMKASYDASGKRTTDLAL